MANGLEISEQNFMAYLERLTAAVGHADRHEPLRVYPLIPVALAGACIAWYRAPAVQPATEAAGASRRR
jgi:hypothetical protein